MQFYESYLQSKGEKKYRIDQVHQAVYRDLVTSFTEISTLPQALRTDLVHNLDFNVLKIVNEQKSIDGTIKVLFSTKDNLQIESVLMRHHQDRNTVCLSSQVGCSSGCIFCTTGKMGLIRNLTSDEMVAQVLYFVRKLKQENDAKVTNIVYMGMGEPFLNYDEVMSAIKVLNDPKKLGFGIRHLTISTCGITSQIKRFMNEELQINLAISLHATNDQLRSQIMPINKKHPLPELIDTINDYINKSKRKVFYEYIMLANINDKDEHAQELGKLLQGTLSHVNFIPFNPGADKNLKGSNEAKIRHFQKILNDYGVPSTIRISLGQDINGACGQLVARNIHKI